MEDCDPMPINWPWVWNYQDDVALYSRCNPDVYLKKKKKKSLCNSNNLEEKLLLLNLATIKWCQQWMQQQHGWVNDFSFIVSPYSVTLMSVSIASYLCSSQSYCCRNETSCASFYDVMPIVRGWNPLQGSFHTHSHVYLTAIVKTTFPEANLNFHLCYRLHCI